MARLYDRNIKFIMVDPGRLRDELYNLSLEERVMLSQLIVYQLQSGLTIPDMDRTFKLILSDDYNKEALAYIKQYHMAEHDDGLVVNCIFENICYSSEKFEESRKRASKGGKASAKKRWGAKNKVEESKPDYVTECNDLGDSIHNNVVSIVGK